MLPPLLSVMEKARAVQRMPKCDYEARVPGVRESLIQLQVALQSAPFPVLLVIAGDEASGKGDMVNILNGWLDPRGVETFVQILKTSCQQIRAALAG